MEWLVQYKGWILVGLCLFVVSGIMKMIFKNKGESNSQAVSGVHSRSHVRGSSKSSSTHHHDE